MQNAERRAALVEDLDKVERISEKVFTDLYSENIRRGYVPTNTDLLDLASRAHDAGLVFTIYSNHQRNHALQSHGLDLEDHIIGGQ